MARLCSAQIGDMAPVRSTGSKPTTPPSTSPSSSPSSSSASSSRCWSCCSRTSPSSTRWSEETPCQPRETWPTDSARSRETSPSWVSELYFRRSKDLLYNHNSSSYFNVSNKKYPFKEKYCYFLYYDFL